MGMERTTGRWDDAHRAKVHTTYKQGTVRTKARDRGEIWHIGRPTLIHVDVIIRHSDDEGGLGVL